MPPEPTVWVVDDEAAMRSSLKWLIESVGPRGAQSFASAEEFLGAYDADGARLPRDATCACPA